MSQYPVIHTYLSINPIGLKLEGNVDLSEDRNSTDLGRENSEPSFEEEMYNLCIVSFDEDICIRLKIDHCTSWCNEND